MENIPALLLGFLGILVQCVSDFPFLRTKLRNIERSAADKQFKAYKAFDRNGQVVLDGSDCERLEVSDSFTLQSDRVHGYVLTLLVVTPFNRYFLFKSNVGGRPYVKELSPQRARLILKERFRCYGECRTECEGAGRQ